MCKMFQNCIKLNSIISLNTKNVIYMSDMFSNCCNFNQIIDFNTCCVVDMSGMFCDCKVFNQSINFDTSNLVNVDEMFCNCSKFNPLDSPQINFKVREIETTKNIFSGCCNLSGPVVINDCLITNLNDCYQTLVDNKLKPLDNIII